MRPPAVERNGSLGGGRPLSMTPEDRTKMNFERFDLDTCRYARGAVVVIDVLRAFSTACCAFSRGAREIIVTDSIERAFALRERFTGSRIMGEDGGYTVPGFDFGNSPFEISKCDLNGATLIQRTSAGTRGLVRCGNAERLFAASFCNASATVRRIRMIAPETVSLVVTGDDEDGACADFLQRGLEGERPHFAPYAERVRSSENARKFLDPADHDFSPRDLELCLRLDAVDFSMAAERRGDLLILRRVSTMD
jgi:2-phosphosulfolactate phosphatase